MIAQMYSMWGTPGWAMVLCALMGPAGVVVVVVQKWFELRSKKLDQQAADRVASENREAGRVDVLLAQVGELREQIGVLKEKCADAEREVSELKAELHQSALSLQEGRKRERTLLQQNEQLTKAFQTLRVRALNEINGHRTAQNLEPLRTWPIDGPGSSTAKA